MQQNAPIPLKSSEVDMPDGVVDMDAFSQILALDDGKERIRRAAGGDAGNPFVCFDEKQRAVADIGPAGGVGIAFFKRLAVGEVLDAVIGDLHRGLFYTHHR